MSDSLQQTEELIKAKIFGETARVLWKELEVLFARGQVVVVSKALNLVDVAKEFSEDNKDRVQAYLDSNQVIKPDVEWVKSHCQPDTEFWAVVVSPFVLIQPYSESSLHVDTH